MRIALYGGAFDPPHVCHLLAATYVLATCRLDEFWILPTFHHPWGKATTAFEDRLAMCELLAGRLGPKAKASPLESLVESDGRTLYMLKHLKKLYPEDQFLLVIGA